MKKELKTPEETILQFEARISGLKENENGELPIKINSFRETRDAYVADFTRIGRDGTSFTVPEVKYFKEYIDFLRRAPVYNLHEIR